jgi:glycosyltransferase involved in cell wall biosynthesis
MVRKTMLSIVIPTFNEEECLPLLLESIKKQSYQDYEIIIADNNSTDNTLEIAKEYNAIITTGGLPGVGRNNAAKIANGELILFLDADVILPIDFLNDILNEFKDNAFGVATCQAKPMSNKKIDCIMHEAYNKFIILTANICPYAPGFCILVRRVVHNTIFGFDERIMLGEDSDYVQRAGKICRFGVLKSHKIPVSVRRLERDGRFNIAIKYILSGLYMFCVGNIKSNKLFKYSFGHIKK